MPHIDKHPTGDFCWIELSTTNQNAAKSFYSSLFGWAIQEFPMGPNDIYTMFQLEGKDTAAAYTMRPEQRSQGVPPLWPVSLEVGCLPRPSTSTTWDGWPSCRIRRGLYLHSGNPKHTPGRES